MALVVLYVGYTAYDARMARERRAASPQEGPEDVHAYVEEMARLNDQLAREAREARASLAKARDTVRAGLKG